MARRTNTASCLFLVIFLNFVWMVFPHPSKPSHIFAFLRTVYEGAMPSPVPVYSSLLLLCSPHERTSKQNQFPMVANAEQLKLQHIFVYTAVLLGLLNLSILWYAYTRSIIGIWKEAWLPSLHDFTDLPDAKPATDDKLTFVQELHDIVHGVPFFWGLQLP